MISKKAYTQINKIIKSMPKDMQEKIPKDLRKAIEYNADEDFEVNIYDIENDELLKDTEKVLSVLYTDYFSTLDERKIILAKEKIIQKQKK